MRLLSSRTEGSSCLSSSHLSHAFVQQARRMTAPRTRQPWASLSTGTRQAADSLSPIGVRGGGGDRRKSGGCERQSDDWRCDPHGRRHARLVAVCAAGAVARRRGRGACLPSHPEDREQRGGSDAAVRAVRAAAGARAGDPPRGRGLSAVTTRGARGGEEERRRLVCSSSLSPVHQLRWRRGARESFFFQALPPHRCTSRELSGRELRTWQEVENVDLSLQRALSAETRHLRQQLKASGAKFRQAVVNLDQAHQELLKGYSSAVNAASRAESERHGEIKVKGWDECR
eukprot:747314-Hanusia_phi.AAC.10